MYQSPLTRRKDTILMRCDIGEIVHVEYLPCVSLNYPLTLQDARDILLLLYVDLMENTTLISLVCVKRET